MLFQVRVGDDNLFMKEGRFVKSHDIVHHPHDGLFKLVFGEAEQAAGLLRLALPKHILQAADLDSLKLLSGTLVSGSLSKRYADLIYSLRIGKRETLVHLVLEHQSEEDPLMAHRMLRYVVSAQERWIAENDAAKKIPPVLPIIFYHGAKPWSAPTRYRDLLDCPDEMLPLEEWVPEFEPVLFDLSHYDEELAGEVALPAKAELALFLFRRVRNARDVLALLAQKANLIERHWPHPQDYHHIEPFIVYILAVRDDVKGEEMADFLGNTLGPRAKEHGMSTARKLMEQGRKEGRKEGREEGREEGRKLGRKLGREEGRISSTRAILLKLIQLRFGPISDARHRILATADEKQLDRWVERILTVDSLDDLLNS